AGFPRLLRNLGGGAFDDVTAAAGLGDAGPAAGALWLDFDGDYDTDLLFWGAAGVTLFSNERGGRFAEVGAAVGAATGAATADVIAEDLDNDGRIDLLLATSEGIAARRNLPGGTFATVEVEALAGLRAQALAAADYNNDGYLDLVVAGDEGLRFFANGGVFDFVPFAPLPAGSPWAEAGPPPRLLLSSDLDGDGGADVLIEAEGRLGRLRQRDPPAGWLAVEVTGIKNNLQGIGATVEVKAGGSYQLRPLRAAPLHFGVGAAESIDVVRIRWPNGIVQNLLEVAAGQRLEVTELERLEGSCPFLYTWNGDRWLFANEVLGAAPLGMLLAEGVFHSPDPDEYVFVAGEDLLPLDGGYEIRVTEELRETSYLDAVRILAIDHPPSLSVLPDEGFGGPPRPSLRLHAYEELSSVRATDQDGRDWSAALAAVDGDWAVPFEPGAYDGLATPHALTLELPEVSPAATPAATPVHLYLTGWVYWSMGSVNLAVDQDPAVELTPVSLDVPDGRGGWRTAIEDIGLPIAKNTTLIVEIGPLLDRADPRVRLRTTMRLYWDAVRYSEGGPYPGGLVPVGDWQQEHGVPRPGILELRPAPGSRAATNLSGGSEAPVRVQVLAPMSADLRPRGFSKLSRTPEGYETFDYQAVVASAPWEQHRGLYTRFGEVGELLDAADDRYVVLGTGDEVAIRFAAPLLPPPDGWRRDFLVYLHGWLKDTDLNTAYGDRVEPLPFHGMSSYPYPPPEHYPDDEAHREFVERYLTRGPRPINPPLGGQR
ncbi:MAG TPA: CRTAC1 family protein, partial [Methylomirabilota bacterium]